jgi:sugar phosphate isomerase/epimerase
MSQLTRRRFLAGAATTVALGRSMGGQARRPRVPLAFSTLGCPKWPWTTVLEQASKLGYSGIELRGIQMQMDLPKLPEFSGTRLSQSLKDLEALDLEVTDLGASARMHEADPAKRASQLDEGRRFIDLAHQMKVPYVRVFGDQIPDGESKDAVVKRVIDGLRTLGEHARSSGVTVIIESHGDFTDSPTLLQLLKGAGMETVALLWDAHHTFVAGKEPPAKTFDTMKAYIRHTHLKDSRPEGNGVRYVLTGQGTVPVRETVHILSNGGYKGFYCFEWEKGWHPEIEEPEVAFPQFVERMREYLP